MSINFKTYTNDFSDSNKYKKVSDIRDAIEGTESIFDSKEQFLFDSPEISDLAKAKELGKLILKVKKAEIVKTEERELWGDIDKEKRTDSGKPSLAFKVLNMEGRVDDALDRLGRFFNVGDFPKDKTARDTKVKELEEERAKIVKQKGDNSPLIKVYKSKLVDLKDEKKRIERSIEGIDDFQKVLAVVEGNGDTAKINYNGTPTELSAIVDFDISDYANTGFSTTGGLFSKDSDDNLTDPALSGATHNVKYWVNYANKFLDDMANFRVVVDRGTKEVEMELGGEFINEKYEYKTNLLGSTFSINYCYLKVLRDIGEQKLIDAIESRSDLTNNIKNELKKYIKDDLLKFIHRNEPITNDVTGDAGNTYSTSKKEEWAPKYDSWHKGLLKKNINEYPYKEIPDISKLFRFMKIMFPPTLSGGKVTSLKSQNYFDSSKSVFLRPSDSSEVGWDGLFLTGYKDKISTVDSTNKYKTVGAYAMSDDNKDLILKRQHEEGSIIPKDKNFESLTLLWWQSIGPLMASKTDINNNDYAADYKRNNPKQITYEEETLETIRNEIRYCKTMKAILTHLGLLSSRNDDKFDRYLLEISGEAEKGFWINPMLDPGYKKQQLQEFKDENIYSLLKEGKLKGWSGKHDYKKYGKSLIDLVSGPRSRLSAIDSEIELYEKMISELIKNDAGYQLKIDELNRKIDILKELDDFDKKPLPDQESKFDGVYKKKNETGRGGKWTRWELGQMKSMLEMIKEKMNNDTEFDNKYKSKKDEIDLVWNWLKTDAKTEVELLDVWTSLVKEVKYSTVEAVKKLIKEKDELNFGLDDIKKAFEKISEKVHLDETENEELEEIKKGITSPDEYKDKPPTKTTFKTPEDLKAVLNIDVSSALFDKWKSFDKSKVTTIIGSFAPGQSRAPGLASHVREKGVYEVNSADKKIDGVTDTTDEIEIWQKLLENNSAEKVIKTIIVHQNDKALDKSSPDETEKKKLINEMRTNSETGYNTNDKENKFKKDKYGDPTEGSEKVTRDQLVSYLYDKALGKVEKADKPWDESTNGGPTDSNGKLEGWKSWFLFKKDNWVKPMFTYLGILILILGVAAFIFWDKVVAWWNGPAEEEGAGVEGKDKEETEEDK